MDPLVGNQWLPACLQNAARSSQRLIVETFDFPASGLLAGAALTMADACRGSRPQKCGRSRTTPTARKVQKQEELNQWQR
ncbi:hypothetical protein PF003_g6636 [Phytophthora fragariae]|nr:hypothetical protein PF003_g6636 [Phytophthora fragariae]